MKRGAGKKAAGSASSTTVKRVQQRRAPSKATDLSRAEVSIMARMAEVASAGGEGSPRYRVLEAALAFKASWIVLGEHLTDVLRKGSWREWGYASFERYCADEVHVTAGTAKKLVRSFQWLGEEAPEYLDSVARAREGKKPSSSAPVGGVPELKAVDVLAEAKKQLDEHRVPEDAYLALKQAALEGETAGVLRRTLRDSIPAHLKPKSANDKVRHLRRALTSCVKVIDALREWDAAPAGAAAEDDGDALIVEAEKLRDAIALRLPRGDAGDDAASTEKDAAE